MNAKRYTFSSAWKGGSRFVAGEDYVLASDYDALAARLAEAERLFRRLAEWDQMNPPMTGDHAHWHREIIGWLSLGASACRHQWSFEKPSKCIFCGEPAAIVTSATVSATERR